MKRIFTLTTALLVIAGLLLSACAQATTTAQPQAAAPTSAAAADTPAQAPAGKEVEAVIGFTVSQTGNLNVESTRQKNGLTLWMDQVNAAGGIKLTDGSDGQV